MEWIKFKKFILETKTNRLNDSASMIPVPITFKKFSKSFFNVKYRETVVYSYG